MRCVQWTCLVLGIVCLAPGAHGQELVDVLEIPGEATDLNPGSGANVNRLSFGSDLHYDRHTDTYYALPDRGPGGGVVAYDTRLHSFKLNVDKATGKISGFALQKTMLFKTADGSAAFNGLNPLLLNGSVQTLGQSFDPEGLVVHNGRIFVADEYGPSLYEFEQVNVGGGITEARFVRSFNIPENLRPKNGATADFVNGRGTITTGRQDNRGFEGLTITPDGEKLVGVLQDPLVNEGSSNDGRRSRNVRVVEFDIDSGDSTAQYMYQLEDRNVINDRVTMDFTATNQGRNIGLSAITAINNDEYIVLERDNRGRGVDNPTLSDPVLSDVGTKRLYTFDKTGATDVSALSFANTNSLGATIPLNKDGTPFIDLEAALEAAGYVIPEKFEGVATGPKLDDGRYLILVSTDNDFSVTQTGSGEQFNVYLDGTQSPLDMLDPTKKLLPQYLYAFAAHLPNFAPTVVPEPATMTLALIGVVGGGFFTRRKRKVAA